MSLTKGIEVGLRLRAAIVDMKGKLDIHDWEESSANQMEHVWMTDCDSLYEHLISPKMNEVENKRLSIDLVALRWLVCERRGERQHTLIMLQETILDGLAQVPCWLIRAQRQWMAAD